MRSSTLTIAVVKATLVVLYFMHVRYSPRLIRLVNWAALFWMALLFALTELSETTSTRGLAAGKLVTRFRRSTLRRSAGQVPRTNRSIYSARKSFSSLTLITL